MRNSEWIDIVRSWILIKIEKYKRNADYMVSVIALSHLFWIIVIDIALICLSKFANANYVANSSGVWVTPVKRFIAIKVNACHATHFLHNHRLSPPRLLIAVSLSLLPRRRGGRGISRIAEIRTHYDRLRW